MGGEEEVTHMTKKKKKKPTCENGDEMVAGFEALLSEALRTNLSLRWTGWGRGGEDQEAILNY